MKYPVNQRAAAVLQLLMGALSEVYDALDEGQAFDNLPAEKHMRAGVGIYAYEVAEEAGFTDDATVALFVRGGEIGKMLLEETRQEHIEILCTNAEDLEVEVEVDVSLPPIEGEPITDPARLLTGKPDGGLN